MHERRRNVVPILRPLKVIKRQVEILATHDRRVERLTVWLVVLVKARRVLFLGGIPLLADEDAVRERPYVPVLLDFWKLHVAAVAHVRDGILDDRPLARQITPHVILFLLLCVKIDKLLDLHLRLPRLGLVTIRRLNLLAALPLVPAHPHHVRLVQEVQEQTLKRARLILVIRLVDRLATKHGKLHIIRHGRDARRMIDALERAHIPEDNLVRIVSSLDETHHTKRDSKLVTIHIMSRPVLQTQLA